MGKAGQMNYILVKKLLNQEEAQKIQKGLALINYRVKFFSTTHKESEKQNVILLIRSNQFCFCLNLCLKQYDPSGSFQIHP